MKSNAAHRFGVALELSFVLVTELALRSTGSCPPSVRHRVCLGTMRAGIPCCCGTARF
jgi:hypothetical protein